MDYQKGIDMVENVIYLCNERLVRCQIAGDQKEVAKIEISLRIFKRIVFEWQLQLDKARYRQLYGGQV